ncbi:hypothetical protein G3R49_15880 [Shewanella sp. WXL01]|uniref:hypothetical protein n=1 Tax=Shewanella sp. WXL01 TaxID=2709721 RepID=UPI0014382F53|nr:hypothetical protein [Shewanella sp. WXL01]NKF52043.1 hypothetical protein [Shewanella sp. WXL01]
MALSRKKWNYIIIAASIMMISVLSYLDNQSTIPNDALPLFADDTPLVQLQLDEVWLKQQQGQWLCDSKVLNCQQWAKAWQNIKVSPMTFQADDFVAEGEQRQSLTIKIEQHQVQQWTLYPEQGLIQTQAGSWYQIPPSLRPELIPVIDLNQH